MSEDELKAAVIGTGNMGQNHVRNYHEIPDCELVAVCDVNDERRQTLAEKHGCAAYEKVENLLREENLDVATVAVPTVHHEDIALQCIRNNVNIIIEKPIADTVEKGERIIEAAAENNVKITVGHIERHNPAVQKLKELVEEDQLGEVNSIVARRVGVTPPQIEDANVIIDLAVHDIDIINYLLDQPPSKVHANGGTSLIENRNDYADMLLTYDEKSALIQVNWITPVKIRKLHVTGSEAYAELDYISQDLVVYDSQYDKIKKEEGFTMDFTKPNKVEIGVEKKEPLREEITDFLTAIRKDEQPLVTPEQALQALKTAEQVNDLLGSSK